MQPRSRVTTIGAAYTSVTLALVSVFLGSCGGSEKGTGPSGNWPPPAVTPAGTPTGPVVTATIGASGGTLQSDDNLVRLEIPAGALGADTQIGIQRISAEAPEATGEAIRLTPDGLQFTTPVTVRMKYDGAMVDGSAPELMTIATQQPDGTWLLLDDDDVTLDTPGASLVFQTTHFSDYTSLQGLQIRPPSGEIDPGESIGLTVKNCTTIVEQSTGTFSAYAIDCEDAAPTFTPPDQDELPALPTYRADEASWAANGVRGGSASVGFVAGDRTSAEFIAPQAPPAGNPVAVSVRVRDRNNTTVSTLVANIKIRNTCEPNLRASRALLRDLCSAPNLSGTSSSTIDDASPVYRISATVRWVYDTAESVPGSLLRYRAEGTATFSAVDACVQVSPAQHTWQIGDQQSGGVLEIHPTDSTWTGFGGAFWTATYTDTCDPESEPSEAAAGGSWFAGTGTMTEDFVIAGTQSVGGLTFTFDFRPETSTAGRAPRERARPGTVRR